MKTMKPAAPTPFELSRIDAAYAAIEGLRELDMALDAWDGFLYDETDTVEQPIYSMQGLRSIYLRANAYDYSRNWARSSNTLRIAAGEHAMDALIGGAQPRDALLAMVDEYETNLTRPTSDEQAALIASLDGLHELEQAHFAWDRYFDEETRESLDEPPYDNLELEERYPRAEAFFIARNFSYSTDTRTSSAGCRAMDALLHGAPVEETLAAMREEAQK